MARMVRRWLGTLAGVAVSLGLALALSGPAAAQEQSRPGGFDPAQVEGIEQIVRDYLLAHPEILVQSLTEFQRRQKVAEQQRQQDSVASSQAALTEDPDTRR